MKLSRRLFGPAIALCVGLAAATPLAAAYFVLPALGQLQGAFSVPMDTNYAGGAQPQTGIATLNQVAAFANAQPSRGNALIGGDATTNLFQRATTGSSVTTTVTYGGPDRWAYWSGTNTAMTVSRDSTATDISAGYQYAFKMARTSGQTGVVQVCMAQEVESANAYQFAGSTAELDFHAYTGANYSAANANMTAYIIYGTGSDEGISKLAWGLNTGGGGSTAWTGQTNATAAVISLGAVSTAGRYAAVATIPATATEIAVALCFTPVGTASTNDYIAFSGIQLVRNAANAAFVSATVGYNCGTQLSSINCTAFERRPSATETALQQRYYYQITESQSTTAFATYATCIMSTTSIANCRVAFPTQMRTVPTMSYATGFAASASTASSSIAACTSVTTSATLTGNAASVNGVTINCASSAGFGAAGTGGFLWDQNNAAAAGAIKANAEL